MKRYKAIALYSGGLDSLISILWMRKLGYDVIPVFFKSFFFSERKAEYMSNLLGFDVKIVVANSELFEILKNPRYGFGKYKNPCIDCHSMMFRKAGELMTELGADFLISGEVLGQRPMSQRLDAMNAVRNYSGYKDLIIRPLSQRLLPDTLPIREGWVKKEELLNIQGRGRSRQMELAAEFGVEGYPTPGGGCLLTEKQYSQRLDDLMRHNQLQDSFVKYLEIGRHFRISPAVKLVIGRNKLDNDHIMKIMSDEVQLRINNLKGPLGLICGESQPQAAQDNKDGALSEAELSLAAAILLSFSGKSDEQDEIRVMYPDEPDKVINAVKMSREQLQEYWITA